MPCSTPAHVQSQPSSSQHSLSLQSAASSDQCSCIGPTVRYLEGATRMRWWVAKIMGKNHRFSVSSCSSFPSASLSNLNLLLEAHLSCLFREFLWENRLLSRRSLLWYGAQLEIHRDSIRFWDIWNWASSTKTSDPDYCFSWFHCSTSKGSLHLWAQLRKCPRSFSFL